MRVSTLIAVLQLGFALTASIEAQNTATELLVKATMTPWKAGGYDDGSDGIAPADFTFAAGPGQVIKFLSVQGEWNCGDGPLYGPDGTDGGPNCNGPYYINGPIGTFAGYASTDFYGALAGIFLEDTLPPSAPPLLRFYVSNNSEGGIETDFRVLNPRIGQVFFIGDGLTGTGTGLVQAFLVPPTATHLYLGYVDGSDGIPQGYSNNIGGLAVVLELQPHN
jgi:hypothetical protein